MVIAKSSACGGVHYLQVHSDRLKLYVHVHVCTCISVRSLLLPSLGYLPALAYTRTCTCITCIPVVLHCLSVCCVCMIARGLFPRLPWWGRDRREEGKEEGEGRAWREILGRKEEDMSVGESTKFIVHVHEIHVCLMCRCTCVDVHADDS